MQIIIITNYKLLAHHNKNLNYENEWFRLKTKWLYPNDRNYEEHAL